MSRPNPIEATARRAAVVTLSLLALCACGSGAGEEGPAEPTLSLEQDADAMRVVQKVREAVASGTRPDNQAIQRLKEVARRHTGEPLVEETLMTVLPALEDWEGIAAYYEGKAELTDDERKLLTRVYIRQADYGSARDLILPVAERLPQDVEANALAGRALYFFSEGEASALHYDRVWSSILEERRVEDICFRALTELDRGEPEKARERIEGALALDPSSAAVHNALSRVLTVLGEHELAAEHSDRASELQREHAERTANQMRVAAQVFEINLALQAGDVDGCRVRIHRLLPEADEQLRQQLFGFLEALYRRAGREAELETVLREARAIVSEGAGR